MLLTPVFALTDSALCSPQDRQSTRVEFGSSRAPEVVRRDAAFSADPQDCTDPRPCTAAPMSSYVRLRGLPFTSTEQDVAQWFAQTPGGPISVTRVLFTYNNAGRKSGESVRAIRPCATPDPCVLTPASLLCCLCSSWSYLSSSPSERCSSCTTATCRTVTSRSS